MKLFIDTREQIPLEFMVDGNVSEVIRTKLPYGDYFGGWEDKSGQFVEFFPVCFERKSLGDLYGTLGAGMERFKREIERAKEDGFKLIIIVEGCLTEVEKGYKHSSIKGESILKTLFTLWVKHDIPHILCNDRNDMMTTILHMFDAIGRNYKPTKKRKDDYAKNTGAEEAGKGSGSARETVVGDEGVLGCGDGEETGDN
jgi:ERCC4-type nuclease